MRIFSLVAIGFNVETVTYKNLKFQGKEKVVLVRTKCSKKISRFSVNSHQTVQSNFFDCVI